MSDESWALPARPFDPRAERRAFRWAVIKTGIWLWVIYFVVRTVLGVICAIAFHFIYPHAMDKFETALQVAHPDLGRSYGSSHSTFGWRAVETSDVSYTQAGQLVPAHLRLSRSIWGSASATLPTTALESGLAAGRVRRADAAAYVAELTPTMLTDAVVEVVTPGAMPESVSKLFKSGAHCRAEYFENPFAGPRRYEGTDGGVPYTDGPARRSSVSWIGCGETDQFAEWVHGLGRRDEKVLEAVSLPDVSHLRKLAQAGLVYGYYCQSLSKADLQSLLNDPAISFVTPIASQLGIPVDRRDRSGKQTFSVP